MAHPGGLLREGIVSRLRVRAGEQAGFTIAEYITAVAILLTVVIGAMSALMYAGTASAGAVRREAALNLASQQIELARNTAYDDIGGLAGEDTDDSGIYTIDTAVSWGRDENNRATCRVVHVTVSWQNPRPGDVEVETQVFGKSEISNTGDVLVNVVEAVSGGTTDPLPGASVTLTPSVGAVQRVTSDTSGGAFFGHVAAGSFNFYARRAGYVVDHSAYATPPQVTGGATTTCQVTAHRPSSYVFTFVCPSQPSVPVVGVDIDGVKDNVLQTKTVNGDEVTFDNLLPDNFTVSFSLPTGYQLESGTPTNFSIAEGNTHSGATVTLVKNTLLVVTVTDDRGTGYPVSGASVTLTGPVSASASTDAQGKATFTITTSGNYTVVANKSNYVGATTSRSIVLGTDDASGLSLARYGVLACTYTTSNTKLLYVYDSNKVKVAQGYTSSKKINFNLPPSDFYYVSVKSSWSSTAKKSGEVLPGQTTAITLNSSN